MEGPREKKVEKTGQPARGRPGGRPPKKHRPPTSALEMAVAPEPAPPEPPVGTSSTPASPPAAARGGDHSCCERCGLLAPLLVSFVALALASLPSVVSEPQLGERWPRDAVISSALYAYPYVDESVGYGLMVIGSAVFSGLWCLLFEHACGDRSDLLGAWLVAWSGCWEGYGWTIAITQLGKLLIAEPRPDFRDRCWPGLEPPFPTECALQRNFNHMSALFANFHQE